MAGLINRKMALKGAPHQTHVAHKVKQFMAGRFVGEIGVGGIEDAVVDTNLGGIFVKGALKAAQLTRTQLFVDKDEGIVEAATFDKIEVQKGLNFMQEDKGATHRNLGLIL